MSIANELGVYHMVGQFLVNLPKSLRITYYP